MAFSRINPPFLGAPLTNGKSHLLRMGIGVAPRCQSAPWIAKSPWPVFGYRRVCLFAFWMPQATRVVFAINSSWASCITQKYECCFQSPLLIHKLNFITINPTSSEQPFLPDLAESQDPPGWNYPYLVQLGWETWMILTSRIWGPYNSRCSLVVA